MWNFYLFIIRITESETTPKPKKRTKLPTPRKNSRQETGS